MRTLPSDMGTAQRCSLAARQVTQGERVPPSSAHLSAGAPGPPPSLSAPPGLPALPAGGRSAPAAPPGPCSPLPPSLGPCCSVPARHGGERGLGARGCVPPGPAYLLQLLQAPPQAFHLQAQLAGPGLGIGHCLPLLQAGALSLVPSLCQQPQLLLQLSQALLLLAGRGAGEQRGAGPRPACCFPACGPGLTGVGGIPPAQPEGAFTCDTEATSDAYSEQAPLERGSRSPPLLG